MEKDISLDRAQVVDQNFVNRVASDYLPQPKSNTRFSDVEEFIKKEDAVNLFQSQLESRHIDFAARSLRRTGHGFYTIGSSGHEGNVAVACAAKVSDPAFLHYRSLAFMLYRSRQHNNNDPKILDQLLSLVAAKDDPISSGRHKVFGSLDLNVPPQTSTISSHIPKAVGAAFSIGINNNLKLTGKFAKDSVIIASFGDASVNHSTFQGGFNAASWIYSHDLPLPIVFVCEDNSIGISMPTRENWISNVFSNRQGVEYIKCDGLNFFDVLQASHKALRIARFKKKPVFLHIKMIRLLGHAGSDIEHHYHTNQEILTIEADDPLLHSARIMIENKLLTNQEILDKYEQTRDLVYNLSEQAKQHKKLNNKQQVMKDLIPPKLNKKAKKNFKISEIFKTKSAKKYNMAEAINKCLFELMEQYNNIIIFGEDVGKKGGVYRITAGLQEKYSIKRVFDTILDEQIILGTAIGAAHNNLIPIPEIQFFAYIHNAIDQIRGEAATLSFFSSGQYTNPMVVRIPGLAYQKGFGGHFHNENSIACLREIPGIIIACPANSKQAVLLLRKCIELAYIEQRVVIFLEPIALYRNQWLFHYPTSDENIELECGSIIGDNNENIDNFEYAIITYGNGAYLSNFVYEDLKNNYNIIGKIIDLNWLHPLPMDFVIKNLKNITNLLIVDECRKTGSVSEEIVTELVRNNVLVNTKEVNKKIKIITAEDSFIPLGDAWQYVLPSVEDIKQAVLNLIAGEGYG